MSFLVLCLLTITVYKSRAQLIGSRGVVGLPEGFVYHDNETLDASKAVAEFARTYNVVDKHKVSENRIIILQQKHLNEEHEPKYDNSVNKVGRKVPSNKILSFEDSRLFVSPVENRFNVPLEEIEKERTNGAIRLLPGEGVIPSQRYGTDSPGRFDTGNEEESERAKNRGETVFDDGPNETKIKYQYKGRPILGEYYDKYFGKTKHGHEKTPIETPRSRQAPPSFLNVPVRHAYAPHSSGAKIPPVATLRPLRNSNVHPQAPRFNPSYNILAHQKHYSYLVNHSG